MNGKTVFSEGRPTDLLAVQDGRLVYVYPDPTLPPEQRGPRRPFLLPEEREAVITRVDALAPDRTLLRQREWQVVGQAEKCIRLRALGAR